MARLQMSTASRTVQVPVTPTRYEDFAAFGEVVHNPSTHDETMQRFTSVQANQGSAKKWLNITHMENHYDLAPSRKAARTVMNMFVCKPRVLLEKSGRKLFNVRILERHPFTPQTFIPLGVSAAEKNTRYLVVVAPTLPTTEQNRGDTALPRPRRSSGERLPDDRGRQLMLKGPGEPDLDNLRAFIFRGDQAVTYGPGTWHAPMVALGDRPIDFVVVQYANEVPLEDCQEADIHASDGGDGLLVHVPGVDSPEASGAGIMRSRL